MSEHSWHLSKSAATKEAATLIRKGKKVKVEKISGVHYEDGKKYKDTRYIVKVYK